MGGKGSGGYRNDMSKARKVNATKEPRAANPETVHWSVELGKELLGMERPAMDDADAIVERFMEFLDCCDRCHMRPLMTGWAMAMDMSRQDLQKASIGEATVCKRLGVTPISQRALQKCYRFMQLNWESNLADEKGNPVKWIFMGKNYFGYSDTTERITRHIDETPRLASPEEIMAKYALQLGKEPAKAELVEVSDVVPELPEASGDSSPEGEDVPNE